MNGVESLSSTYRPVRLLSLSLTTGGCILLSGRRLTMLRRHFPWSVAVLHTVQTISRGAVLTVDAWLAATTANLSSTALLALEAISQRKTTYDVVKRNPHMLWRCWLLCRWTVAFPSERDERE